MTTFEIGDRVRVDYEHHPMFREGDIGIVLHVGQQSIEIDFSQHQGDRMLHDGHWWADSSRVSRFGISDSERVDFLACCSRDDYHLIKTLCTGPAWDDTDNEERAEIFRTHVDNAIQHKR